MADLEKTVEIIFSGKDDITKSLSNVSKKLADFDSSIMSIAKPLASANDAVLKLDAALVAMAIAGLAVSIKQAGDFNDSFNEIASLIGDTGEGVQQFKKDILDYSRDSGMAIDDIVAALYTAQSAEIDYKVALDALSDAEKLSVAGKAELGTTLKVLTDVLDAYGESTDQASNYSDTFFTIVKKGKTTLPELSTSLAQITGIAANAGIPFETLGAALAALTGAGLPTSQAITQLKAAINNIISPSGTAAEQAEHLEIAFNAEALATQGLDGMLKNIYDTTGGNITKMGQLFGSTEALNAALILGADKAGKFASALQAMKEKTGATEAAYKIMADNFGLINQNLANNVKATFIQVGLELLDEYTGVVRSISNVFKSLGISIDSGAFDEIFKAFDKFGADLKKFFDELAASLPQALKMVDFSGLLSALEDLGLSVKGMFGDFDPSNAEDVRDAIQFVIDSIQSLITVTKGIVNAFAPFIEAAFNSVEAFNKMDDADKEITGTLLGLAKAIVTLGTSLAAIMLIIGDNAEAIESSFNIIIGSLKAGWGGFKTTLQLLAIGALEWIDTILAGIEKVTFGSWNEDIKEARIGIQEEMGKVADRLVVSVKQVNEGWDQVADHITGKPAIADVEIKPGAFKKIKDYWDDPKYFPSVYVEPKMDTDAFRDINKYLNDIFPPVEKEMAFNTVYRWTDESGSLHTSDTPPGADEIFSDLEEVKMPIWPDVPDEEIDKVKTKIDKKLKDQLAKMGLEISDEEIGKVKKKIKKEFSPASLGPVNLAVSVDGTGVGPAFQDSIENQFKDNPLDMGDIFDAGSLDELFTALESAKPEDRARILKAIDQAMELQKQLADAQTGYLKGQSALLQQQWQLAYMTKMSAEQEGTIRIQAEGLEPEMEAFMYKLLKKIQVRANESGAEFLLAAGS